MKNKFVMLMILSAAMSFSAFSQEIKKLSLQQVIDLSIANSGQLKNNQAKIEEATWALKEAVQRQLPDASVSSSYLRLSHANVDLKTKSTTTTTPTASPNISSALYGIANITYPVYAGGRIKYGIEAAKYLQQATQLDAEHERQQVQLNATNAFINLYKSKAVVELVKENLASSQQRVKDLTNMEKNGLLARNDLMKAELQQSNIELSLLDAENNWKLSNVSMDLLLGLPVTTTIETDANFNAIATLTPVEIFEQDAIQNRKDIAALALRTKAAGVAVKSMNAEKYPSVALTGGYIAANIPGFVTITNAVNIGIGIQYNLGSLWKNKAKVEQARSREKQLEISEGMLSDAVRLQVHQSYEQYLLAHKKIEVYQKAIDQATENFRIVNNKYKNSLATTTEVLDADVALLQTKLNYANAKADAVLAYNQLLITTGNLK
jgi:outer membrane protein